MSGKFLAQLVGWLVGRCDVDFLLEYRWAAYIVRSISAHF